MIYKKRERKMKEIQSIYNFYNKSTLWAPIDDKVYKINSYLHDSEHEKADDFMALIGDTSNLFVDETFHKYDTYSHYFDDDIILPKDALEIIFWVDPRLNEKIFDLHSFVTIEKEGKKCIQHYCQPFNYIEKAVDDQKEYSVYHHEFKGKWFEYKNYPFLKKISFANRKTFLIFSRKGNNQNKEKILILEWVYPDAAMLFVDPFIDLSGNVRHEIGVILEKISAEPLEYMLRSAEESEILPIEVRFTDDFVEAIK